MVPLRSIFIGDALADTVLESGTLAGFFSLPTLARLSVVMSSVIFLCWSRMVSVQYT